MIQNNIQGLLNYLQSQQFNRNIVMGYKDIPGDFKRLCDLKEEQEDKNLAFENAIARHKAMEAFDIYQTEKETRERLSQLEYLATLKEEFVCQNYASVLQEASPVFEAGRLSLEERVTLLEMRNRCQVGRAEERKEVEPGEASTRQLLNQVM